MSSSNRDINNNTLLFLAEIMEMNNLTSKKFGFVEIFKVDSNTFTIKSIDQEEFVNAMPKELVDELAVETDND